MVASRYDCESADWANTFGGYPRVERRLKRSEMAKAVLAIKLGFIRDILMKLATGAKFIPR
jgi:hypothetical protein